LTYFHAVAFVRAVSHSVIVFHHISMVIVGLDYSLTSKHEEFTQNMFS